MLDDYQEILNGYKYTGYYSRNGGEYHRTSGPARIWHADHPEYPGRQEWYLFGEQVRVKTQKEFESFVKMRAFW